MPVSSEDFSVGKAGFAAEHSVPLFVPGSGFGIPELTGYPDVILVPDPATFRVLPWASRTGWCLSDMYFSNGKPAPFCSRQVLRARLGELAEAGYDYVAGLEVEFYITKLVDAKLRIEAVEALDGSELFRRTWGGSIVDYLVQLKRFEWDRFMSYVTDWEQNEYFEVY